MNQLDGQILVIGNNNYLFNNIINLVFIILGIIIFIAILIKVIKYFIANNTHHSHKIFLIRLPREKPEDNKKEDSVQNIKEEIAKGETIFSAIGGLKAQRGFRSWLLGRDDLFSFELVANSDKIAFYIACPPKEARYIEQQIHAHYPEAMIEEVDDYNGFSLLGEVLGGYLKTTKKNLFPIKTYQEMDVDMMNSIVNVLSKLDKDESLVVQYVVRSAKSIWHQKVGAVVHRINKKQSVSEGVKSSIFEFLKPFADSISSFNKKDGGAETPAQKLTAIEEELLKKIEEKNSKAGLNVNIRVIVSSNTKEKARKHLEDIASAFSEYNNFSYGNNFSRIKVKNTDQVVNDFIYRRFKENISFLLNSQELASIFHLPLSTTETPNILWLRAKLAPAPYNIPNKGISLGNNLYRGINKEIRIKRDDRRRHTYIIGKSGVGKSVLLTNMAVQDIQNGEGVCVIDPHGDLITDILNRIPPERAEDVIIFSPADLERPLALNLLEYDPKYPEQKSFVINEMIGIFDKLYDLKSTGGPMFEQYMRNAMLLIMDDPESGSTLMEIPKVLADEKFRKLKLSRCKNQTVIDFWHKEAEKAGGEAALANIVPYITSKLTSFISNDMMRPIIGQQKSAFNIREIMDKQKILLIELPKGTVGEMNAYLLGMILVGKILMAALSRTDMSAEARKDFYLYIDEFQNFTTNSIAQILSEARKYALNLIIAHQYIGQLTKGQDEEIKDAVFGNVGTIISFKVGIEDAEFLSKEFAPVFNEYDLINIDKGIACTKLLVDNSPTRPFTLRTIWPVIGVSRPEIAKKIRFLSRLKYGKNNKLVEAEIKQRSNI